MAWAAAKRMRNVWISDIGRPLRVALFKATIETVILYGAETLTLTQVLSTKLDGTYTKLLRYIFQRHWSEHPTIAELYGDLPKVSTRVKRSKLTQHLCGTLLACNRSAGSRTSIPTAPH